MRTNRRLARGAHATPAHLRTCAPPPTQALTARPLAVPCTRLPCSYTAFGPGNIDSTAKITIDFYDGETGEWASSHTHAPTVNTGVASVGNMALFANFDGRVDVLAIDGNCSAVNAALPFTRSTYNLSSLRGAMSAAPLGSDSVCFAGGVVPGSPKDAPPSDAVECLNLTSGHWLDAATLPHRRSGSSTSGGFLSAASVAFFGGNGSIDLLSGDASSRAWRPSVATKLKHEFTSCAGVGHTLVCAGGQGLDKSDTTIPFATDVFTLQDSSGSLVARNSSHRLSVGRKKLSAAAQPIGTTGGVIGFAMGFSDIQSTYGYSATYDLYDVSSGRWSNGTLPSGEGRQYGTAVGCGGKLVFAGGQIAGGRSQAVDVYDVHKMVWSAANLSVPRSNLAAACAAERYALFAGGQTPGRDVVDMLDTRTGEWHVLSPLSYGRGWLVGAGVGACAVFAGGNYPKHSSERPPTVDAYCFHDRPSRGADPEVRVGSGGVSSGEAETRAAPRVEHTSDRDALLALGASLHYAGWRKKSGWMGSGSVCKWYGVTCDDKTGRVTKLELSNNRLNGSLPEELGNLTELTLLSLEGSRPPNYHGCTETDLGKTPLPRSFYSLPKLQVVNIEYACLGGSLLDAFGGLRSMVELHLHGNFLTGKCSLLSHNPCLPLPSAHAIILC